jgi:hypothetical protein
MRERPRELRSDSGFRIPEEIEVRQEVARECTVDGPAAVTLAGPIQGQISVPAFISQWSGGPLRCQKSNKAIR